ncbi:hypothetical protein BaRGS_00008921 [Batillaria attramentaria]|uniref:Ig-like domain-containing protein n=1 Tax=Batillaria attramentaria TaxID=370345 RepID=A0ABD0LK92_9CAEN
MKCLEELQREPGDPKFYCPEWVMLGSNVSCHCNATRLGSPPATVGWAENDSSTELNLELVEAERNLTNYTCQLDWKRPGMVTVTKKKIYTLKLAHGPVQGGVWVKGPGNFKTDGLRKIELQCFHEPIVPPPVYEWEGGKCAGGNKRAVCKFVPHPVNNNGDVLTCLVTSVVDGKVSAFANYTVRIDCKILAARLGMLSSDAAIYIMKKNFVALNTGTGEARILNITTEFTSGYVAVTKANQHLKLNCEVFGNPVPKVKVYRKPNQNGSKFGEEGEEQPLEMSKNITEYRKLSTFHVWANEICGVTDTFRCDAENKNGEDSKYVTVRSNCTRVAKRNVSLIIGLHIVGVTSLLAMATLTMYFLRQRNKEKKWREYGMGSSAL